MMVLAHFTGKPLDFQTLDKLTGKLAGQWTWPTASLIWLMQSGYELKLIEEFSFEAFAGKGKDYLIEKCGLEVANAQEAHSNLRREQKLAKKFVAVGGKVDYRIPQWPDLEKLFKDGYLIICNINANKLYRQAGYSGHFVLPIEITDQYIVIHDPGLPPAPALKVDRSTFETAWGYPAETDKNILAIRKQTV